MAALIEQCQPLPPPPGEKPTFKMNTDRRWLLDKAAAEDGCCVGVGADPQPDALAELERWLNCPYTERNALIEDVQIGVNFRVELRDLGIDGVWLAEAESLHAAILAALGKAGAR